MPAPSTHASTVERWHDLLRSGDLTALDGLLAENAVFHSPVVHTPQRGKALVTMYLSAAAQVLLSSNFRYVREVIGPRDAVLEFEAEIDGIHINGVDMFHWNEDGRIDDFKVMIRPLKAVNLLHGLMKEMLEATGPATVHG
ncbi:MAG TPA: nuclear transport factor 2 family protein [Candidatus Limnocylindrales bacterium]|nr:nuclear transport factor 2 family protein [Candidatus Limnocylindrales bacterium]